MAQCMLEVSVSVTTRKCLVRRCNNTKHESYLVNWFNFKYFGAHRVDLLTWLDDHLMTCCDGLTGTGNPLNIRDPMGMGLDTKLNPWQVMDFLVGIFYINGHEFGMAKPSEFVPVAMFNSAARPLFFSAAARSPWHRSSSSPPLSHRPNNIESMMLAVFFSASVRSPKQQFRRHRIGQTSAYQVFEKMLLDRGNRIITLHAPS